jgi:hypothetical protein
VYYRLLIVDSEGNQTSSRIISVTVSNRPPLISVHPNPFDNILYLRTKSELERKITILFVDMNGKLVRKLDHLLRKGDNTIQISNLQKLGKGVYMMRVGDDAGTRVVKVMRE